MKIEDDYTNQNAVILNAYMKVIGIHLEFETDDEDDLFYADVQTTMVIDGYTVVDFRSKKNAYHKLFEKFNEFMENYDVVQTYPGMKEDIAWDWVFSQQDSIEDIDWSQFDKDVLKSITQPKIPDEYFEQLNDQNDEEELDSEIDSEDSEEEEDEETSESDEE